MRRRERKRWHIIWPTWAIINQRRITGSDIDAVKEPVATLKCCGHHIAFYHPCHRPFPYRTNKMDDDEKGHSGLGHPSSSEPFTSAIQARTSVMVRSPTFNDLMVLTAQARSTLAATGGCCSTAIRNGAVADAVPSAALKPSATGQRGSYSSSCPKSLPVFRLTRCILVQAGTGACLSKCLRKRTGKNNYPHDSKREVNSLY